MKKYILLILCYFSFFNIAFSFDINANIESWEYDFPLEVYLNSDEKDAKIFYYTDSEGRFDNIKEYFWPIIIIWDTKLNYFATLWYKSTKIKENNYYFNYTSKLDLINKDDFLYLKNKSSDTQNIWLWRVKTDWLNFEIPKNTFLEVWEIYKINYQISKKNTFYLYSPDGKLSKNISLEKNIIIYEIKQDLNHIKDKEKNIEKIKNEEAIKINEEINEEKNISDYIQNTKSTVNDIKTLDNTWNTKSEEHKKETKTDNTFYLMIYLFVFITLIVTAYNIYTVVKNSKNITNNKP